MLQSIQNVVIILMFHILYLVICHNVILNVRLNCNLSIIFINLEVMGRHIITNESILDLLEWILKHITHNFQKSCKCTKIIFVVYCAVIVTLTLNL